MKQNLDPLKEIERFTASHPGIAVKGCSKAGHCSVYMDGQEENKGVETVPMQVMEPGEHVRYVDCVDLVPTRFWLGTRDKETERFVPQSDELSEQELLRIMRG